MDGYVIRFRCNLSGASCDVPMELTRHEQRLLVEISEKVRMAAEWDFQMEVLADTQHISPEQLGIVQEGLRNSLRRGMITPEEANPYFAEGDI